MGGDSAGLPPVFHSARRDGERIIVAFDRPNGLCSRDGKALTDFELAGGDGVFHPASAMIAAGEIRVVSPAVSKPTAVRFGWNKLAVPDLVNRLGVPAAKFRIELKEFAE